MKAVVLSPHLDDAVLSVGATMSSLRRRGIEVLLVTAFAGDPMARGRASYWDARRRVADKADAVAMRHAEDDAAAAALDVKSVKLPFEDFAYVPPRDPEVLWDSLEPHLEDAEIVLLPGWPLIHPDHRYLTMLTMARMSGDRLFFYEELPYGAQPVQVVKRVLRGRRTPTVVHQIGIDPTWRRTITTEADFTAKREAAACYVGEIAALGRHATFGQWHDRLLRRETVGYTAMPSRASALLFGVQP